MRIETLLFGSQGEQNRAYLNQCLRELYQQYVNGGFSSREEYLEARRTERDYHRETNRTRGEN